MDSRRVTSVLELLYQDYFRQGEYLGIDDVLRVIDRRGLEPTEALAVHRELNELGITISDERTANDRPTRARPIRSTVDPVKVYLREVTRERLLSPEDEVRLARRIKAGSEAVYLLASASPSDQEILIHLVNIGERARERMILANTRLVISIARKHKTGATLGFRDLVQEGVFGLAAAVEKFDHKRGLKFSTYATHWIEQSIRRAIENSGRTIRIPSHACQTLHQIRKTREALSINRTEEEVTVHEVAEQIGIRAEKVAALQDMARDPLSLDSSLSDDNPDSISDFIPSADDGPEARALRQEIIGILLGSTANLTAREQFVLRQRFGLDDGHERTLEEIGSEYGVTRERIRQIESKALGKLRKKFGSKTASTYYGFPEVKQEKLRHGSL